MKHAAARAALWTTTLAVAAALTACGGGDGPVTSTGTSPGTGAANSSGTASALAAGGTASALAAGDTTATTTPTSTTDADGRAQALGRRSAVTSVATTYALRYAQPPVGPLRWKPPVDADDVAGAAVPGPVCPQFSPDPRLQNISEDCLTLNVHAPAAPGRYPVMVWLHGGAYVSGAGFIYDPQALVRRGVVVVTVNYRVGVFGYMATPALSAEQGGHSGNYGLLDQQSALRWVQRHIAQFQGDPRNVTVFGQSTGGMSVLAHMASPASGGLFHKAIVMSGGPALVQSQTQAEREQMFGDGFNDTVGCAGGDLTCLRALPVPVLLAAQQRYTPSAGPVVDGAVLPLSIGQALRSGRFNHVPLINGATHDEWAWFVAAQEAQSGLPLPAAGYGPAIQATLQVDPMTAQLLGTLVYPLAAYASPSQALTALGTDALFSCTARETDQWLAERVPTYAYEFNDPEAPPSPYLPPASFPLKAYHTSELPYLFGDGAGLNAGQQALSAQMVGYFTRFAATGVPEASGAPAWQRYRWANARVLSLAPGAVGVTHGYAVDHRCLLWSPIIESRVR